MREEEEKNFNQVTLAGYLANSLMMKMKKRSLSHNWKIQRHSTQFKTL